MNQCGRLFESKFFSGEPISSLARYTGVRLAAAARNAKECGVNTMVDEQTFVSEVQDMERMLYRVSRGLLPSLADCEDAVQEALRKAWEKRGRVDAAYFRPWLMRIVINECHNLNRRRRRETPVSEVSEEAAPSAPDPLLRQAVSALPDKLRIPLLLHHLEGFGVSDVARILRLPQGTVKSRLHQARKRLKDEWEEREE